jgi:hypothetical protein
MNFATIGLDDPNLVSDKAIKFCRESIDFIMAQHSGNGEATVGSDGPRQKGKATPETIK